MCRGEVAKLVSDVLEGAGRGVDDLHIASDIPFAPNSAEVRELFPGQDRTQNNEQFKNSPSHKQYL